MLKEKAGEIGTQSQAAKRWNVSERFLSAVLTGAQSPGVRLAKCLGLRRVVYYERIE